MEELVRENARVAREMRGVALLEVPDGSDSGWSLRRSTLLRPRCPPILTKTAPTTTSLTTASPSGGIRTNAAPAMNSSAVEESAAGEASDADPPAKRARRDGTLISVTPNAPLTAPPPKPGGDNGEPYVPPPSWKLSKVLVGHQGWVWSAAVDPTNSWFATGGGDGIVKVWDLTTGALRLNLTGHKEAVRAVALSGLSPYMYTGSDDHSVKCWDLERNEMVRDFHGHKGSVHCVAAHPALDVVLSGGRDKTVRVWDVRTRVCAQLLVGHTDSVMSIAAQQADPQLISGGSDGMVHLWDIAAGRALRRLTRHKKPVRGLAISPRGGLVSCGADAIRVWSLPSGAYSHGAAGDAMWRWSCCAISPRGVLAVGSQEGRLALYDWRDEQRAPFQSTRTKSIPGTLPGEGGINCVTFDASGSRMITAESDKSVKIWRTKE